MKRLSVVLCCAALAASACGGSKPSIAVAVASSAEKTAGAKTAKVRVSTTIEGDSSVTNVVDGIVDFEKHISSMTVKTNGLTINAVSDGKAVYEKLPAAAGLPKDKPWLKLTFAELGKAAGLEGLDALVSAENDPTSSLNALRGAGKVTKVGTEKIRGESTTQYHAVIDYARAAAEAPEAQRPAIRSIAKTLGTPTQPIDVWLDGDGRVRRYTEKVDLSHANLPTGGATLPKSTTVTAEYYEFGTSVKVAIPPASQVTNFADVFGDDGDDTTTPTVPETPATTTLASKLLTTVLPGYKQEADDVGDTGPSDLDKAVRDDGEDDAREALTKDGFVAGYQRYWTKGDNEIIDFVYQFKTAPGAAAYLQREEADLQTSSDGPTVSTFAVSGIPGAKGYTLTDGKDTGVIVTFARGGYAVQVNVTGADANPANATQLAKAQYDKLG